MQIDTETGTETDGGLAIKVETENWQTHSRISAARLRELVHRVGGDGDHFLVVHRIPDRPGVFIQVAHERGGVYEFQHRTGSVPYLWITEVTDPDLVAAVMARWARGEADWDADVSWRRDDLAPPREVPAPSPELAAQAEAHVREMLADGYLGIEKLIQETVYLVQDGAAEPPLSPAQARVIVERLWLERVEEQETWTAPTDPDRLERAFAALEDAGVVARENFACCRGCGMTEIGAEADGGREADGDREADGGQEPDSGREADGDRKADGGQEPDSGRKADGGQAADGGREADGRQAADGDRKADGRQRARGFVFFPYPCTRGAAEGHGLTLYYGGFDDSEETTRAVGHQVVAALGAAGLSARWDGDPAKAIDVTPLTWRKRLAG